MASNREGINEMKKAKGVLAAAAKSWRGGETHGASVVGAWRHGGMEQSENDNNRASKAKISINGVISQWHNVAAAPASQAKMAACINGGLAS